MNVRSTDRRLPLAKLVRSQKTWADKQGIPTGMIGDKVDGIPIREANRATTWEEYRAGIEMLRVILHNNYRSKGVRAVLYGVPTGTGRAPFHKYSIFVQNNFLRHIDVIEDED